VADLVSSPGAYAYCEDNGFARLLTASDFYIDMSADQILSASFEGTPQAGSIVRLTTVTPKSAQTRSAAPSRPHQSIISASRSER
jgi:hypothetical protein